VNPSLYSLLSCLLSVVNFIQSMIPGRYGHAFQFSETGSKGKPGERKVIERKEAARHILGILRKLRVRWTRTPKQLPGWKDSL